MINETCALSGFSIVPRDPVKLLFLTRSPYVESDQKYFCRGHYHNDQWFVRTPPITAVYDDYRRCKFKKNYITKIIEDVFAKDVYEEPFGHNQFHATGVFANPSIEQLIEAADQGRLRVRYHYVEPKVPEHFPTWRKIRDVLLAAGLKIMINDDDKAYNVQEIGEGIVYVHFNAFGGTTKEVKRVQPLLKDYDSKFVLENETNPVSECGLLVVPKGTFDDPAILASEFIKRIQDILSRNHPLDRSRTARLQPVKTVMVRQDVWELYRDVGWKTYEKLDYSVAGWQETLQQVINEEDTLTCGMLMGLPISGVPYTEHLKELIKSKRTKSDTAEIFAETCRVETTMAQICQAWQIPASAGTEPRWDLHKKLNTGLKKIITEAIKSRKTELERFPRNH